MLTIRPALVLLSLSLAPANSWAAFCEGLAALNEHQSEAYFLGLAHGFDAGSFGARAYMLGLAGTVLDADALDKASEDVRPAFRLTPDELRHLVLAECAGKKDVTAFDALLNIARVRLLDLQHQRRVRRDSSTEPPKTGK